MKRLILLVTKSDDYDTFVVGAWEEGILDSLGVEEIDKEFAKMKKKWWPDGTEWREVPILVDEESLLAAFVVPEIVAEVEEGQ
jgi:hypothetical protein